MHNFNENWDGVRRKGTLNEKYYATGKATDKLQIIPAKWVYEKFFARLKAKGKHFLFNQKIAEESLEWVIALMHDPKSELGKVGIRSHGRNYGDAFDYAEKRYMSRMGLKEETSSLTEASRIKWISKRLPDPSNPMMSPEAWVSDGGRFTIRMQTVGGRTTYYLYDTLAHMMPGAEYDTDWRNPLEKYSKKTRVTGNASTLDAAKKMAERDLVDPLNRRK